MIFIPNFFVSTYAFISTVPFPITLTFLSSTFTSTIFIPKSCISFAASLDIIVSFSTNISPVSLFNISLYATWPAILEAKFNFLLNLYLPTFAKSYLLGSKNKLLNKFLAASTVGSSPGLNFLYISTIASSLVFTVSFAIVARIYSSSPNKSTISLSVVIPKALNRTVTGSFLVLSILT